MKKAVIALVPTREHADACAAQLHRAGFSTNDISVLFPDDRTTHEFAHEQHTKAPEGAVVGGVGGGVVGGTLGLLAGLGSLAIPGLGPFIAAGPIMAALSGIAAGATAGGLVGALVGMGIPEIEAKTYAARLRDGNILIAVHTEDADQRKAAKEIFKGFGIKDATTQTESSVPHKHQRP